MQNKYDAFHPGKIWLDTNGNRIQAHGGSVLYENGAYYWYGETRREPTAKATYGIGEYAVTDQKICTTGTILGS